MLILLDCSKKKIDEYSVKYEYQFGQLRTPLTKYAYADVTYAVDNGAFTEFHKDRWLRLIEQAKQNKDKLLFVTMPDIVGSARRTSELFDLFKIADIPKALVLQDGIENVDIPWNELEAVFIGGTDRFKESRSALDCCRTAKMLDKWVHVGRVNTIRRLDKFIGIADSIDGSGISRYTHMLNNLIQFLKNPHSIEQPIMELAK